MAKYKKCPRCELNWIPVEEELCEVCKAELGKASSISLIEDDEDGAYEEERVCPVCKVNNLAEKAAEKPEEEDESWKEFVGEDSADDLEGDDAEISLSLLQEEEEQEAEEEEESYSDEPDDFDESITAFDENDYDEDEEDDDDEDDDI